MNLYIQILVHFLLTLVQLSLFHYDLVKDICVLSLLNEVETSVLDGDREGKFQSVGGVHFQVVRYYLILIFVVSEMVRYYFIHKRQSMYVHSFDIPANRKLETILVKLFPLHFILMTKCWINIKILLQIRKLKSIFPDDKEESPTPNQVNKVIEITYSLDSLAKQVFYLNEMETSIQLLETLLEREPQSVVQLSLFLLMQKFNPINILFDTTLSD